MVLEVEVAVKCSSTCNERCLTSYRTQQKSFREGAYEMQCSTSTAAGDRKEAVLLTDFITDLSALL